MAIVFFKNIKFLNVRNPESLIRNGIVTVICLLGMGGSFWGLRQDQKRTSQMLDKTPVGIIYWVNNNAKRLSTNRLQWDRLQQLSPIYNGDTIVSDDFSEVKINFIDGETLELSENTSVRILYQDSKTFRFVLREGEIQVQSAKNSLTVSLAESAPVGAVNSDLRINLKPGTIAAINSRDGYYLKIYQGSGILVARGESHTIGEEEVLMLGKDGLVQELPPAIVLAPRNGTWLLQTSKGKLPVEFLLKRLNSSAGSIRLEIARSRNFSSLEGSWYLDDTDHMIANQPSVPERSTGIGLLTEIELAGGTYFWRIFASAVPEGANQRPGTEGNTPVDSGRLEIIYTQGPLALSPADGDVKELLPRQDLRFSWTVPEVAEAVVFEAADNPEMKNPRLRQTIKRTKNGRGSYDSSELTAGKWFWRIQPVYPDDIQSLDFASPVNSFTLVKAEESVVQKTVGSAPAATPGAILQLMFPPDNYSIEANRVPDLLFTWKNTFLSDARFQISERPDFSGSLIKDEEVFSANIQCPFLAPGIYYWRIIGADQKITSPPNRLVVTSALNGPKLESPSENERLRVREGVAVRFSWEPVNYANYYQFSLFLEERELPLSEISFLQNNSVNVYFDPNTSGQFKWTVQGFRAPTELATGQKGLITQGRFYIAPETTSARIDQVSWTIPRIANIQSFAGEVYSPISLISPRSGINIPGIQALRSPPIARWASDALLRNTQLIISHTSDPLSDPMAVVIDVSGNSATFPSLSEGIWYWIIRGDSSDLRGATPGDPFWFTVLPIPSLSAPRPIQPLDRTIGLEQLTNDRNITFRWDIVEEANAYIFSLFLKEDPPKLIISASPQTSRSFVLEDLSLLNQGDYLWQVEAIYLNANGVIEQRGRTEQNPFSIEIKRSDTLQTHSQGTLYGQ